MNSQLNQPIVSKGAFLISRQIFNSEIWEKPPHFIKIWLYLIGRANHKEKKSFGRLIKKGQCFIRSQELIEKNDWKIGYRTEKLTKGQIRSVLDFLRKTQMISTMKSTRGLLITINNYIKYQTLSSYEYPQTNNPINSQRGTKIQPTINKNYKNEKNTYSEKEINLAQKIANWGCNRARQPSKKSVEDYKKDILPHIKRLGIVKVHDLFSSLESNLIFWSKLKKHV